VLDHGDSVPLTISATRRTSLRADVIIFGLHLSPDPKRAGALLVFTSAALHARFSATSRVVEPVVYAHAAEQLQ
jgi:hypothetical protein